jgi:hypothetical protein
MGLPIEMDELVFQEVVRAVERFVFCDEPWAAHGENSFAKQEIDPEAGIIAVAKANGDVNTITVKIKNIG